MKHEEEIAKMSVGSISKQLLRLCVERRNIHLVLFGWPPPTSAYTLYSQPPVLQAGSKRIRFLYWFQRVGDGGTGGADRQRMWAIGLSTPAEGILAS